MKRIIYLLSLTFIFMIAAQNLVIASVEQDVSDCMVLDVEKSVPTSNNTAIVLVNSLQGSEVYILYSVKQECFILTPQVTEPDIPERNSFGTINRFVRQ